jgi:hypothetical protein
VDRTEAAGWLGVDVDAPADVVRRAFRRLVVRHHPDVTGAADTSEVRRLTEAYRVLRAPVATSAVDAVTGDTITVALPPDEAFDRLLDAAAAVGDVTYVDPEAGLLEVLVTFDDGRRASAVVSLQGRAATGATDAFVTLEPLDDRLVAPVEVVVAALAHALR